MTICNIYGLSSIMLVVLKKRCLLIFLMCCNQYRLKSKFCTGGHLGFQIHIKNSTFAVRKGPSTDHSCKVWVQSCLLFPRKGFYSISHMLKTAMFFLSALKTQNQKRTICYSSEILGMFDPNKIKARAEIHLELKN